MRPIYLVPAERVEVRAKRAHVDGSVRRKGDGVDTEKGVGNAVDGGRDGGNVGYGAEDVGGVGAGDESGVLGEERLERFGGQMWVCGGVGGRPEFEGDVEGGGEEDPGGDVGFVVDGAVGEVSWELIIERIGVDVE